MSKDIVRFKDVMLQVDIMNDERCRVVKLSVRISDQVYSFRMGLRLGLATCLLKMFALEFFIVKSHALRIPTQQITHNRDSIYIATRKTYNIYILKFHIYHNAIKGPHFYDWERAAAKEIIRLFDSSTGKLIHMLGIPKGRQATYFNPRCRIKMKNGELQYRVRGTAGGDKI